MFSIMTNNPWQEEEAPQVQHAIATLVASIAKCPQILSVFPALKNEIKEFQNDLEYIAAAYREDIRSYRQSRAFTAVHLPSLFETIALLQKAGGNETEDLSDAVKSCLTVAAETRKRIQGQHLEGAKIALEVINPNPPEEEAAEKESTTGLLGRWSETKGIAKGRLTAIGGSFGTGYSTLSNSASRAFEGATEYASAKLDALYDQSINRAFGVANAHLSALMNAAGTAIGATIESGLLTAIIFPPALPLAVGAAVLEGTASYSDHLEKENAEERKKRQARARQRDAKTQTALDKIKGKSPIVSLSSPHVYVTINTDENTSQGTILSGRHIGKEIDSVPPEDLNAMIKHAPDPETRQILNSWKRKSS